MCFFGESGLLLVQNVNEFFEENNLTLNEWIKLDTFTNPKKDYKQDVTLLRALEYDGGMNYIRKQLVNLHWWKH